MGAHYNKPKLSPKRREWLEHLRDNGPGRCPYKGSVGLGCRTNGWTEWVYVRGDDEKAASELNMPYKDRYDQGWRISGREQITELGRATLKDIANG